MALTKKEKQLLVNELETAYKLLHSGMIDQMVAGKGIVRVLLAVVKDGEISDIETIRKKLGSPQVAEPAKTPIKNALIDANAGKKKTPKKSAKSKS